LRGTRNLHPAVRLPFAQCTQRTVDVPKCSHF
jgi:hypothetical protein